jgi:hypothetical protein
MGKYEYRLYAGRTKLERIFINLFQKKFYDFQFLPYHPFRETEWILVNKWMNNGALEDLADLATFLSKMDQKERYESKPYQLMEKYKAYKLAKIANNHL